MGHISNVIQQENMNTESQNIEFKESWRDEYQKWICGFANAQGGTLYIGLCDNGEVCGVQDVKKSMEDIPNKVRDMMGILVDVNLKEKDGKQYLEIVTGTERGCTRPLHASQARKDLGRCACSLSESGRLG